MNKPIYRDDIKGNIREIKEDCTASMRGNIATADDFILCAEDCPAYDEYAVYLTETELQRCFRAAQHGDR